MKEEKKIIEAFKNEVFPLYYDEDHEEEEEEEETITDANKFREWVNKQEKDINNELFKNCFKNQRP